MNLTRLLILGYTLGPAAALPYAVSYISEEMAALILLISYLAPLPLLFYVFDYIDRKQIYPPFMIHALMLLTANEAVKLQDKSEKFISLFIKSRGLLGYYLTIIFVSFAMGFMWGALIAYLLDIPKRIGILIVTIGTALGVLFWYAVIKFSLGYIDPFVFIIILLSLSALSYVYGVIREQKIIKKIISTIIPDGIKTKIVGNKR